MKRRILQLLAATGLALGGLVAGLNLAAPAQAEPVTFEAVDRVDTATTVLAAPRDIECDNFLGGTRIYCVHGTDGNVVAAMENYAGCRTETDCAWDYRSNTSGPYAGDGYWMLYGTPT